MGVTTVTQEQYQAVMEKNPSRFKGDKNPVEQGSWNDAQEFCERLSQKTGRHFRLPTEAEWEYACRAGTTTAYYTGARESDLDQAGWYDGNSNRTTHPVGQKQPNAWGLYDMHGNVRERCHKASAAYPTGPVTDPTGAEQILAPSRVLRGGSWYNGPRYCRSADRSGYAPDGRSSDIGFRACLDCP